MRVAGEEKVDELKAQDDLSLRIQRTGGIAQLVLAAKHSYLELDHWSPRGRQKEGRGVEKNV